MPAMLPARTSLALLALLGLLVPAAVGAQVANPLPRAHGMGGSHTALARGLAAPAWNPAGLGMPDNPGFSITILAVNGAAGLGPVDLGDLADSGGERVPYETRVEWLDRITRDGGEAGAVDADLTTFALNVGRVAVSASSSVRSRVDVAPDVAELVLFGNAGLTGEPGDGVFEGSSFDAAATTTFAASVGIPLVLSTDPRPDQHLAVGATLTYTLGHFLALGLASEGRLQSDPPTVDIVFPVVNTPLSDSAESTDLSNGSGIGLDVGAAWQGGRVSAALVVRNVFNTFEWDTDALEYRKGIAAWDADSAYTSFQEDPLAEAPEAIVERLEQLYTFAPILAAGAAVRVSPVVLVTGEVRHALEDNLGVGAQSYLGVGSELRAVSFMPVRAGVAVISGGYALSGGIGFRFGGLELAGALSYRDGRYGDDTLASVGLTYGLP
jgi:hypothetical protein